MDIETIDIRLVNSPSYNPRDMPPAEMEKLERSISEFGYVEPIIVNKATMNIVGGNQRYQALKNLGYSEIDVVFVDIEDLNREKALNIALNRISGDWDEELLSRILTEMELEHFDISLTGFDDIELKELIINESSDEKEIDMPDNVEDFWENYAKFDKGTVYYSPSENRHNIEDLYKLPSSELDNAIDKIENEELKEMLRIRRDWFVEFNFAKIADYYVNQATPDEQRVFEMLGLVLLDLDQMLKNNFSTLIDGYVTDEDLYKLGGEYEK